MQDFNEYAKNAKSAKQGEGAQDMKQTADAIARAFEGKGEADILRAIYAEAERSRKAGTLSDAEIDNFYAMVAPMLDGANRKKLDQIVKKLKKMD